MERTTMRVLVATDGSPAADTAVELAANVPWPAGTEILVLEAVQAPLAVLSAPWSELVTAGTASLAEEIHTEAGRTVANACRRLERPGLCVSAVVLEGRPSSVIVDRARIVSADLIVLGSRGHGTIGSMLLGSVSAEVVDHAQVPVLVARGPRLEHVLLAWDGSTCADQASSLLQRWPIFQKAFVRVLSVDDVGTPWWTGFPEPGAAESSSMYLEASQAARTRHERLAHEKADGLRDAGLETDAEHRDGDAATQIIAAAASSKADVIVMGTHGRTGVARLVMGSVARNVLHHAPCSILIVRERRH